MHNCCFNKFFMGGAVNIKKNCHSRGHFRSVELWTVSSLICQVSLVKISCPTNFSKYLYHFCKDVRLSVCRLSGCPVVRLSCLILGTCWTTFIFMSILFYFLNGVRSGFWRPPFWANFNCVQKLETLRLIFRFWNFYQWNLAYWWSYSS